MRNFRRVLLALFVGATVVVVGLEIRSSKFFVVKSILIEGLSPQLNAKLQAQLVGFKNQSIFSPDLEKITQIVAAESWVESVQVLRKFPDKLEIICEQKKPPTVVNSTRGRFFLIDNNAQKIADVSANQIPDLPLLSGENFVNQVALRQTGVSIIKNLPTDGVLSQKDVSHIEFEANKGFIITLKKSGIRVLIGEDEFSSRVERSRRVIEYLNEHKLQAHAIDAVFSNKVVVRTNDSSH